MKSFKNKVVMITGAGGNGIGHHLAMAFAAEGAKLAICDIAKLEATLDTLPTKTDVYHEVVDMADTAQIDQFIEHALNCFDGIDILVNNAGIALGDKTFDQVTPEDFQRITDINYWGVVHTTQRLYEHLLSRPEAAILNLSSSQGILALPNLVPYCTTKFAVRGFTDSIRAEHKVYGIKHVQVHTIHPGRVATNITLNADYHGKNTQKFHKELQRGTQPDKAAQIILRGIRKKRDRIFISDGRQHDILARLLPTSSTKVIKMIMKLKGIDTHK